MERPIWPLFAALVCACTFASLMHVKRLENEATLKQQEHLAVKEGAESRWIHDSVKCAIDSIGFGVGRESAERSLVEHFQREHPTRWKRVGDQVTVWP